MGNEEFDRLIGPIKLCNQIWGTWPTNEKSSFLIKLIKPVQIYFMFLLAIFYVITTTIDVIRNRNDMNEATECALIASTGYLTFFRFVAMFMHRKDFTAVVEEITSDWYLLKLESKQILRDKTYYVYRLGKFFIISILASVLAFATSPLLEVTFHLISNI